MAIDQVENPPEHAHSAPPGEIRQEPRSVLAMFTWIVGLALIIPILALVVEGVGMKHLVLSTIGGSLIVILGTAFLILLWKMISSRKASKSLS
jgi:hypothetical protein